MHSPNLGDGVIADCLVHILRQVDEKTDISLVDFSGRINNSTETCAAKTKLNCFQIVHRFLGQSKFYRKMMALLVWNCKKRKRLSSYWRQKFANSNIVVIGGGQLLMDNELSFILRVREIVKTAHSLNKKVVFYACGVGDKWSRLGSHLLAKALLDDNVSWISIRDCGSRETLQSLLPSCKLKLNIAMDPALFAADTYGINASTESNIIGLGILSPSTLRRRTKGANNKFSTKNVRQFWINLAKLLTADHQPFAFFTNGRSDDYAFAESIIAELCSSDINQQIVLLEQPDNPRHLVEQIAQFKAIVAHRLHANMIAYSLCIPSIGLVWDTKVAEFGKMTKRENFYLDTDQMDPNIVQQKLYEAISTGIDKFCVADQQSSSIKNLHNMLGSLEIVPSV